MLQSFLHPKMQIKFPLIKGYQGTGWKFPIIVYLSYFDGFPFSQLELPVSVRDVRGRGEPHRDGNPHQGRLYLHIPGH